MKIDLGGTPIYVSPRRIGGVEIIQGRGRVRLSPAELTELRGILAALDMSASDAHGQEKMTTIADLH